LTARDNRLHAFRPDLADARLRGEVDAQRFVEGRPARIAVAVADLHQAPRPDAGLSTQALFGDDVRVFDIAEGWAWIQLERDGYVGYVADTVLTQRNLEPTHVVVMPRTFTYPGPDLKLPATGALSMGSRVAIAGSTEARGTRYALLASGEAIVEKHLALLDWRAPDFVAVAETLINTPYLWAGTSGFGIDCSGLVQLSMRMAGVDVLRDSDMQAATLGEPVRREAGLARGDLVFWKGHVAMMTDAENMIHANGHSMTVALERLDAAIERVAYLYGSAPTGFTRPR
jgi:cell wall-associated NlpC family hydrolase